MSEFVLSYNTIFYSFEQKDAQCFSADFSVCVLLYCHGRFTEQQGKERDTPLYHFQSLTNLQAGICSFASELTASYF